MVLRGNKLTGKQPAAIELTLFIPGCAIVI